MKWPSIIALAVFILLPALKQIADYLERKKQQRSIEGERQHRRQESLRTGRPMALAPKRARPAGAVSASDRLREIQEKRRQALEQARRRAQTQLQQAAQGMSEALGVPVEFRAARPTSAGSARAPGRAVSPGRTVSPGRPQPTIVGPVPPTARRQRPASPARSRAPLPSAKAKAAPEPLSKPFSRRRREHAKLGEHSSVHRLVADAEPGVVIEEGHAAVSPRELAQMSAMAWRRALVLQEVLSPPLALRESAEPAPPLG